MKHTFTRAETIRGAEAGLGKANKKKKIDAEQSLKKLLNELGFELISEYIGRGEPVTIKCLRCGSVSQKTPHHIKACGTSCFECKHAEVIRRQEIKRLEEEARRIERIHKRKEEAGIKEAEHQAKLNAPHTCKVCGKAYTISDYMKSTGTRYERNSGYCSRECRDKAKAEQDKKNHAKYKSEGKRYRSKHYTRAKKLGLPVEEGVTLKKLIARDGLTCKICGKPCIYNGDYRSDSYPSIDHIRPIHKGGGHTWDNVQVAHRICNSVKSDRIGTEWGNAQKPGA